LSAHSDTPPHTSPLAPTRRASRLSLAAGAVTLFFASPWQAVAQQRELSLQREDCLLPAAVVAVPNAKRIRVLPESKQRRSPACVQNCGELVEYVSWRGKPYTLRRFAGQYVQVLLPDSWLSHAEFSPATRRSLVDGADLVYQYYMDLTGNEPPGEGLLPLAFIDDPFCGYGCGNVGGKGVEALDDEAGGGGSNRTIWSSAALGRAQNVIVHEMGHNFETFGFFLGKMPGHWFTDVFNHYFYTYTRWGTTPYSFWFDNTAPGELEDMWITHHHWNYLNNAALDWDRCVFRDDCHDFNLGATGVASGANHRVFELFGPTAAERYFDYANQLKATNPPEAKDVGESEDINIAALAYASGFDLGCFVDQWRWHASPQVREWMAAHYPKPAFWCNDVDGDGKSPLLGDCNDNDPSIGPGREERSGNRVDDDCDGFVDEVAVDELSLPGGFSTDPTRPTSVTFPVSLAGTAKAEHTDHLIASPSQEARMRMRFCALDGAFVGAAELAGSRQTAYGETRRLGCEVRFADGVPNDTPRRTTIWTRSPGRYRFDAAAVPDAWPWPAWGRVEAFDLGNGSYRFRAVETDTSHTLQTPTRVRFWVTGYGWVGDAPYSQEATLVWTPTPPLIKGRTYGVRAELFAGKTPASEITAPKWFGAMTSLATARESAYVVTTAAHTPGAEGTYWMSDLVIHNPLDIETVAYLFFLRQGYVNTGARSRSFVLGKGQSTRLGDVVLDTFGHVQASGAIVVACRTPLHITSKTFNNAADGTYGQFIPGISLASAATTGEHVYLPFLSTTERFRTNIGVVNLQPEDLSVTIQAYSTRGTLLGETSAFLDPFSYVQLNKVFANTFDQDVKDWYAVVSAATPDALFATYASVIDNVSGDPIHVLPAQASSNPIYVASVANTPGNNQTVWRTDLEVFNPGPSESHYQIAFLKADLNNQFPPTRDFVLAPGATARYVDVVGRLFGELGSGTIRVTPSDGTLACAARTYNNLDGRTYGQYIAGVPDERGATTGERRIATQLSQAADDHSGFRTNFGVVNMTDRPLDVQAEFFRGDGTHLGNRTFHLEPYSSHQEGKVFRHFTGESVADGYIAVSSPTAGARFHAYASVVDNRSGDPFLVPARTMTTGAPIEPTGPACR
jgi:hypothetical protein